MYSSYNNNVMIGTENFFFIDLIINRLLYSTVERTIGILSIWQLKIRLIRLNRPKYSSHINRVYYFQVKEGTFYKGTHFFYKQLDFPLQVLDCYALLANF